MTAIKISYIKMIATLGKDICCLAPLFKSTCETLRNIFLRLIITLIITSAEEWWSLMILTRGMHSWWILALWVVVIWLWALQLFPWQSVSNRYPVYQSKYDEFIEVFPELVVFSKGISLENKFPTKLQIILKLIQTF